MERCPVARDRSAVDEPGLRGTIRRGLVPGRLLGRASRIEPTEAAETLANFVVAEGFRIELVAAEPLVASPVAIEWDADGSMYVCEMRGYSENRDDRLSRIRRLTDIDQDGVYDQSQIFIDGLLWPTAIFPFDGGLFVGDAPDLLYCKDTDGDGVADVKKVVLTGFGTSNVQGLMNSFRWGLDNRIHIACSSVGGSVHRPGDLEGALEVRRRDLAFDPRSFEIEQTSGGAQHGMCFDDWGRKFVSSNSDHIQQVMYEDRYVARNKWFSASPARVSIAADGPQAEVFRTSPVEPWRIVRTRLRVGGIVPGPIEGGGRAAGYFTGATGVTIYRGDAWPARWKGLAIVGDVGSNLIHRKRLEPNGVQMIARRIDQGTEFVSSSDIWFRPAQFANAPDGTLHVIDVCREVIEHPKSLPEPIKRHLDLTAGRDRGRIYRIVASDANAAKRPPMRLDTAETSELVSLLEHPNAWHRETAARLIFERQDRTVIDEVRRLAAHSSRPQGRLHAIYALDGIDALDAVTLLSRLNDDHPQVRRHAVRLSEMESINSEELNQRLAELVDDPSIEVRYQLAFSLGSIDHPHRIELLTRLIRHDVESPWMRLAVQSSLAEGAVDVFVSLASDPQFRSAAAAEFLSDLALQISKQGDPGEMQRGLETVAALTESDPLFALPVATQLIGSGKRRDATARLEQSVGRLVSTLTRSALTLATDSDQDTAGRVRAVRALALGGWDEVNTTLSSLIDHRHPIEVQRASIETIGNFTSPGVADLLLARWNGLSPSLRQLASEVLFARPDRTEALYDAVDRGELAMADLPRRAFDDRGELVESTPEDSFTGIPSSHRRSGSNGRDCPVPQGDDGRW